MARTKKPAGKAKGAASPAALAVRLVRRLYQPSVLFPTAVSLAMIITWPYLAAWAPDLRGRTEFRLSADRILLSPRAEWTPHDLTERVLQRAGIQHASLLDDDLTERLARAFQDEPWVKQVRSVSKRRGGLVNVELDYRRPVLMAATTAGVYPVDEDGVLLPPTDFTPQNVARFPLARNVRSFPSGPAGQPWGDPVVAGAARLAARLIARDAGACAWDRWDLEAILLPTPDAASPLPEDLSYQLQTRGGSQIVWGQAPGGSSLEPPVEVKLERLNYYLQQCGSFETAAGPSRIDITGFDVIRAKSLQGAQTPPPRSRN